MIMGSNKILTIIPARGGSKGVPKKNIRILNGRPLIAYTIEAALGSKYLNRIIVSTDDIEIAKVSSTLGVDVPFIRPEKFSTDTSRAIEVVKHALLEIECLDNVKYDIIVYLEPPAPFRITEDIDNCIDLFNNNNPDSVVSVNEANQFHPILMKQIVDGKLKPIWKNEPEGVPRQLYKPAAFMRNGAVYVLKRKNILKDVFYGSLIVPYIMPEDRSICIDSMMDWYSAEAKFLLMNKESSGV